MQGKEREGDSLFVLMQETVARNKCILIDTIRPRSMQEDQVSKKKAKGNENFRQNETESHVGEREHQIRREMCRSVL